MHRITDLHLCEGLQICVPRWKSTILYTLTEDYKFVHLCRVIQMITNLYTFTEDYKFVHLHRGLQICTPLQRITNLCALMFTHTFIDRCTLDHCHGVPLQPLLRTSQTSKLATLLQCIVITIQENQWLGTAHFWQGYRNIMDGGHLYKLETLEDQRPSKSPQNNTMDWSCAKRFNYSFWLCTYFH